MNLKIIEENEYINFIKKSNLTSFYQSLEWKRLKEDEKRHCELVGLYDNNLLVGVSLIIYTPVLKKFYMAYASRGFIYDYKKVKEFTNALKKYFQNKKVIFFRMDPPIVLASYDKDLKRNVNPTSQELIAELKNNGFIHYGYNMAYETTQFRFIHRVSVKNDFNLQLEEMSKSTKKNIEMALFRGVKIKEVDYSKLDDVLYFLNLTSNRKHFKELSKVFYERLIKNFNNHVKLYITYIDKKIYINNLNEKIKELKQELESINIKKNHDHIGNKLKNQEEITINQIKKYEDELMEANKLNDEVNIASLVTISMYDEVIAFASGMDNNYRKFNPKYVFYPQMFKDAIKEKKRYVNFLGVKNILDKKDPDYGIYEVKRGFGGETIEYIGEFDLPVNNLLYKLYKIVSK